MNTWIITAIVLATILITVLVMDTKQIRKLNGMVGSAEGETRHWKRKCAELRMEINILEERDAKQVAHLVLIRDEQIEQLERTMRELEAKHQKEMNLREKRIFQLEKAINDNWPNVVGERK